ncbi:MAG: 4-hydroxy-tetrahydrodipicolinate reductase [Bacteroidota bacterium]
MKIAIIGYGKMGKTIERLALDKGHEILLKLDQNNTHLLEEDAIQEVDVAIEFTNPDAAPENVRKCIEKQIPIVSGSTGWYDEMEAMKSLTEKYNTGFFHTSNFSIGVHIFRAINRKLANIMNNYPSYQASMEEIHHTSKLDAPSGTAVMLANEIINANESIEDWINENSSKVNKLGIVSKREGDAKGTHSIKYASEIDDIIISHVAHSRDGFALGAITAAEWLIGKIGFYNMNDLLDL